MINYTLIVLLILQAILHLVSIKLVMYIIIGKKPETRTKPPNYNVTAHQKVLKRWRNEDGDK